MILGVSALLGGCVAGAAGGAELSDDAVMALDGDLTAELGYSVDWGSGYCAKVTVSNSGASAIARWTVVADVGTATVSRPRGAQITTSGTQLTATSIEGSAQIAPSDSAEFSFCGSGRVRPRITSVTGEGVSTGTGGSSGTGGSGGSGGAGGSGGGTGTPSGTAPSALPTAREACPTIATGTMSFLGREVRVWAGARSATPAPVVIYWHATSSSPQEALAGLGQAAINEITSRGGVVFAPNAYDGQGGKDGTRTTLNDVWYMGDFNTADEAIACAIQQRNIDTSRIHALGFSAGGVQSAWMAYARSSYVASVVSYSGGKTSYGWPGLQDASNPPAVMAVHGAAGSDVVVIDLAKTSADLERDIKAKGGFAIDCNSGGGHNIPSGIAASSWQFLKDHPYKVRPEPYAAGIPSSFPDYCAIP
ncbi:cellulose binding domain-containing protein [Sorangium sp. So ce131]|uniref:cellulose binding domain-containing protein n=1 Tax=Sorangium sp. So ce131 TaxID=3133282 RepID=UPI003F6169DB